GRARQDGPAEDGHENEGRRQKAAAKVVEDLPALEGRQRVGSGPSPGGPDLGGQPGQDLPVSAGPAVLPPGVGRVAAGKLVEQLDVRDQAASRVVPLDQVVAEDLVVGEDVVGGRLEGVDVVDALAGVAAGPEQVLVDVGDGGGIRVETGRVGVYEGE